MMYGSLSIAVLVGESVPVLYIHRGLPKNRFYLLVTWEQNPD